MAERGPVCSLPMDNPKASPILSAYLKRTPECRSLHERASQVQPGGNSRQASYWAPYPVTLVRGQGVHVWDVDANRYVDLVNNYSAMVHGHSYPPIAEAVAGQVVNGTGWAASCPAQVELAEQIVARSTSVEQLRFTNSGTEAGNLALTIARIVTGRRKLLMARYGYHGSLMEFETGTFGHEGPLTFLAGYNDANDFRRVLQEHGSEIAAVFLEPMLGAGGVVSATREFLREVGAASREAGALLVLDEVITFRLGAPWRREVMGVEPDVTMYGKLIGGGYPVGAVGARKELMKIFDPDDLKAFHTGTYNANPITMTAGNVAVQHLTEKRVEDMETVSMRLREGLTLEAAKHGLPFSINHVGSVMNLYFSPTPPDSPVVREDGPLIERFHLAAMNHGLLLANRGLIALSTVTTEAVIDEVLERTGAAMADVANEVG